MSKIKAKCFYVNTECNWKCSYCITNTHKQPKIKFDDIKERLKLVENNDEISLTGGEPGLLSREILEYIFNYLESKNCLININTNGTFLKRYPDYYNRVNEYLYHASENISLDIDINQFDDPKNKIIYMLVVTDESVDRVSSFLKKYNYNFHLHAAKSNTGKNSPELSLSRGNALKLYNELKHVDKDYKKYLLFDWLKENELTQIRSKTHS